MAMRVRFWGTRGSLPAPLNANGVRAKLKAALQQAEARDLGDPAAIDAFLDRLGLAGGGTFGGNTSCVEVETGADEHLILDLGSGARGLGNRIIAGGYPQKRKVYNVLMSHPHWDHIMGLPFFTPVYVPGHTLRIHGGHADLERAFRIQHGSPGFPVDFGQLGSTIEFVTLEPGTTYSIAGAEVGLMRQHHSGDSYGYRISQGGRSVIYSTDSEHRIEAAADAYPFVDFFRDADLVIFDAMYSLAEAYTIKEDWGHSSNLVAVELCHRAGAARLCLFHHDPNADDRTLAELLDDTIKYEALSREDKAPLAVLAAYDGLELDV
jgi:phosphoribosyl 1,2-cyclic phosphodiesterase